MTKKPTTASKPSTKAKTGAQTRPQALKGEPKPELVVFAFRLTQAEREAIHKAAGPAKASKFVRTLSIAASKGDVATLTKIGEAVRGSLH